MNRPLLVLIVGASCASILAIGACGGSSSDDSSVISPDATFADTGAGDTGTTTGDTGAPLDSGAPIDSGTPIPDAGSCADFTDGGCFRCCAAEDPDAAAVIEETALTCACNTNAACKTDCADTLCKKPKPTAPDAKCDKCLAQPDAGGCFANAKTAACGSSTSCDEVATCLATCPD